MADKGDYEHLRSLADGSLSKAEVGVLLDRLEAALSWREKRAEEISLDLAALVKVRKAAEQAVAELDADHSPLVVQDGKKAIGCVLCFPGDGSWPCTARMIADDLRAALNGSCTP